MTLRTRAFVLLCPLFLASMQLIGSEVKQVTSTKQLNASLFTAVKDANIDQIRALLVKGAEIEAKDYNDCTPLIRAAQKGHVQVWQLLIEKGADIEAKDNDGLTPLIRAAYNGHAQVCQLLIEKGADIEAKDKYGYTPLMKAADNGHAQVCQLLMQRMLLQPIILDRVPGACKQKLKEVLLVFNRREIPKEITRLILCSTPELKADLLYVLYNTHKRRKNISQEYMNILKAKLPQMVCQKENLQTVRRALKVAQSKAGTEALRTLLDPNTLESRIHEILDL